MLLGFIWESKEALSMGLSNRNLEKLTMHCYNTICLAHSILRPAFVLAKVSFRNRTQRDAHHDPMHVIHSDRLVGTSLHQFGAPQPEVHRCRLGFCDALQRQLLAQTYVDGIVTSPDCRRVHFNDQQQYIYYPQM